MRADIAQAACQNRNLQGGFRPPHQFGQETTRHSITAFRRKRETIRVCNHARHSEHAVTDVHAPEYGFDRIGSKGEEQVWAKRRPIEMANDPHRTFPFIDPERDRAALLAIKPEYHALMFGDNRLRSEAGMPVEDEIPTNTIEKVYLSGAPAAARLEPGDRVVIYRTGDGMGPAEYRAVVSAVCTITETRHIDTFGSRDDFLDHLKGRSVFRADELDNFWGKQAIPMGHLDAVQFSVEAAPYETRIIGQTRNREKYAARVRANHSRTVQSHPRNWGSR